MNTKKFPKITIDGKQYPTRTSMGAMLRYTRETGNDTLEFQTLSDTITYLWCCVVSACSAEACRSILINEFRRPACTGRRDRMD